MTDKSGERMRTDEQTLDPVTHDDEPSTVEVRVSERNSAMRLGRVRVPNLGTGEVVKTSSAKPSAMRLAEISRDAIREAAERAGYVAPRQRRSRALLVGAAAAVAVAVLATLAIRARGPVETSATSTSTTQSLPVRASPDPASTRAAATSPAPPASIASAVSPAAQGTTRAAPPQKPPVVSAKPVLEKPPAATPPPKGSATGRPAPGAKPEHVPEIPTAVPF